MKKLMCIAVLSVMVASVAAYSDAEQRLEGLVIFAGGDSIEVKRGRNEAVFRWSEASKVTRQGAEADRVAVEICQRVRVTYAIRDGEREVISLDILEGSYCVKE
ncbi:MAG: hypothetical protein JW838_06235 [Spirochaetes bacterium]|nr:hypothetical protein [Spirochaetota bacterium]